MPMAIAMAAAVATAGTVLSCLSSVCVLWLTGRFWCHTEKARDVAHLLPGINQIHAGAKHLHQLFLIV